MAGRCLSRRPRKGNDEQVHRGEAEVKQETGREETKILNVYVCTSTPSLPSPSRQLAHMFVWNVAGTAIFQSHHSTELVLLQRLEHSNLTSELAVDHKDLAPEVWQHGLEVLLVELEHVPRLIHLHFSNELAMNHLDYTLLLVVLAIRELLVQDLHNDPPMQPVLMLASLALFLLLLRLLQGFLLFLPLLLQHDLLHSCQLPFLSR
mmetsp:Transcript_12202/g.42464  ORF Transcript_12202/g.42464 Transcript_12202/m.42464 type:complete len:206 (-) Transcript_12202:777-1394(-)